MPIDDAELERRFTAHPTDGNQNLVMHRIRTEGRSMAELVIDSSEPSREQSLAITALEEAVFWANAAVARPKA